MSNTEKSFIEIDKHNLDEEWVDQPRRFRKYSRLLAAAKKKVSLAKAYYELTQAELSVDIKTNPHAHGLQKAPSDPVVKNLVLMHKKTQKAKLALIEAEYEEDQLKADVGALAQRKSALQDLVILQVQDYFAEPKIKGDKKAKEKMEGAKLKEHFKRGRIEKSEED